ncbi:hypothetical protein LOC71_13515 [Rhodopirellula sp. JC740]|uniref:Uncharacterized protein n=1 Tax=Rhodopirellula halodulae TaxID=2894198 RepID=A0ABS8NIC2_9BACT|nr:hypothetical protein [Rhodopirellula sp. JC740]MCC9643298.1 hypothetical protein [Rhodopirellula sp. JC740]
MNRLFRLMFVGALLLCASVMIGCKSESSEDSQTVTVDGPPPESIEGSHHDHPEHGPNGGELIELGKEAFHLEMLHDANVVTLNVLDSSATQPIKVEAKQLTVNLKHDGEVRSFTLNAAENSASSFSGNDPQLVEWVGLGAEGAVTIQIQGKSYSGKITHDHDHSGHDHEQHDH